MAWSKGGLLSPFEAKNRSDLQRQGLVAKHFFQDIIGASYTMQQTIAEAQKYAAVQAPVLITGESGTGKELFAQSIHNASPRYNRPFVAINCASLPENLLESELFGYVEGAFTGAKKGGQIGLFALAHTGTIFLDEIGEPSPAFQARLLRVLQQQEVLPVGGRQVQPVDVRIISATNKDLPQAVAGGSFRSDLYYRLNVLPLHLPPLRDRIDDVPLLFNYFYQRLSLDRKVKPIKLNGQVLKILTDYPWPGNVRELASLVERYVALGEKNRQKLTTLLDLLTQQSQNILAQQTGDVSTPTQPGPNTIVVQLSSMAAMERQIIKQAQALVPGGKVELAKVLGVSRTTLWKKLREIN